LPPTEQPTTQRDERKEPGVDHFDDEHGGEMARVDICDGLPLFRGAIAPHGLNLWMVSL
jgi:hypothetical protein